MFVFTSASQKYFLKFVFIKPFDSRQKAFFLSGVTMSHPQDPKNEAPTPEISEQLTAEAELLAETFESADSLEDFTKALMDSLTSKLHTNIDEIFKKNT
jgi:hypothetical protein